MIYGAAMSLSKVDLNLFIVFDAIYQQRNLTRASEVLCMSQPAVSNALARLRESLDDPLFVRASGGVRPTPLADNIIDRVQEALKLLESSVNEGSEFDPYTSTKTFRLSMNDMAEAMVLPGLLKALKQKAPSVAIECYYIGRADLERELSAGTVDLALDVPLVSGPQICVKPLVKQRYVCAVRKDHPDIGDSITLDQYLQMDHLQVSSRRKGFGFEDYALQRLGRQRRVKVRVPHHHVAPTLLKSSDMVLTLPANMARLHDLKVMELPFTLSALDWSLYWHNSADQDQANMWLRDLLMETSY